MNFTTTFPGSLYQSRTCRGGEDGRRTDCQRVELPGTEVTNGLLRAFCAENELGNGLCKLILDEDEHIIGCHLLGNPASELIVVAGIAIEHGYTVEEFKKSVFPHPTVGEIFHETLFA